MSFSWRCQDPGRRRRIWEQRACTWSLQVRPQARDKRISIVEAKRDDIEQGMAENVTGLEALSDVEGLDVAYGIVTSYLYWVFIIDDDVAVRQYQRTLFVSNALPENEPLKKL